ncbi:endonuclease III [Candidatus Methylacidithermus pantelleriae]|nr:endonuclease III [Candidatus Methylacidithermus pantelleriae]
METLAQKRTRVARIIEKLASVYPDARLELEFSNPLELLIALILAAQARDTLVNSVTRELFARYRTAQDWASQPQEKLERELSQINFYRKKAQAIREVCQALVERFQGEVPNSLEALLTLPGVGRKTANILLGNAFGQPTIGVDTHVARLSQRLGLTRETDPDKIEQDLLQLVPEADRVRFCHLLQFHGRRVCLAKKPRCPDCVIESLCPYPHKTRPGPRGT